MASTVIIWHYEIALNPADPILFYFIFLYYVLVSYAHNLVQAIGY